MLRGMPADVCKEKTSTTNFCSGALSRDELRRIDKTCEIGKHVLIEKPIETDESGYAGIV